MSTARASIGQSKFGIGRFFEGAFDFITVIFITRFRQRPLHFFGAIGMGCSAVGVALGVYLTLYKLIGHHAIGTRPLLFLALLLIIVGVQLTATGIIGEQLTAMTAAHGLGTPASRGAEHFTRRSKTWRRSVLALNVCRCLPEPRSDR